MKKTIYLKFLIVIVLTLLIYPKMANASTELTIHAIQCNVWGDATLLESKGNYLLMDTCDKGEDNKVLSYLDNNNVTNLDLYLTHYNEDHFAKMMDILNSDKYTIKNIYLPTYKIDHNIADKVIAKAEEDNINIVYPKLGDNITLGDAKIEIIGPQPGAEESSSPRNDNSLVAKILVGNKSAIISGDIEKLQEELLLKSSVDLKADILKLAHHGMDTSNTEEFIKAVNPTYAFYSYYSAAEQTEFAHDASLRNVVNRVIKYSNVLSTEYNGNLKYNIIDDNITVTAEKNYLKATIHYIDKDTNEEIGKEVIPFNSNTYLHLAEKEFENYVKVEEEPNDENDISKMIMKVSENVDNLVTKNQDINVYYQKIAEVTIPDNTIEDEDTKVCTAENGIYYDNEGNKTTLENFKKVCPTVENPATGVVIPILLVFGAIIVIMIIIPAYKKTLFYSLKK